MFLNLSSNSTLRKEVYKFSILPFFIILTSCEGYKTVHGQVLDHSTGKPIDSVKCEVLTGMQVAFTDSSGHFSVSNSRGPCVPKCKDITIKLSKPPYKSLTVTNPSDTIFVLDR